MNDLDRKIAEGIDDEALFRLAEGEEHEFSPEYHKNMERLYRKAEAHPKRRMVPLHRIVAVAALIAVLTGTAAAATFWEEIQQFFVTTFGQYVELQPNENSEIRRETFEEVPKDWKSFWYPKWCQKQYDIASAKVVGKRRLLVFKNGTEELSLYQWDDNREINTDNDAKLISGICVGDKEAYAVEKDIGGVKYRTLIWTTGEISFELDGTVGFDELSRIAESLVLIER